MSSTPLRYRDHLARKERTLSGYVKVRVDVNVATALAETLPKPEAAVMAVMKCVASYGEITLEQCRILFGRVAQRALL